MDKKELLKENNTKQFELDKYIDNLCNDSVGGENNNDLLLCAKMKKYINDLSNQESEKANILMKLSKYEDIFKEFCEFLLTDKVLKKEDSVCEKGYTAYDILDKEPCLFTHIAFLWLTDLRDNTDEVSIILKNIKYGLPVNSFIKLSYNVGIIKDYFNTKRNITDAVAKQLIKPYFNHPDIANEFEYWIRKKQFIEENPIMESGYTAKKLYEEYSDVLDIQGVFSLMITLREDSDKAIKWIKEGLPRK